MKTVSSPSAILALVVALTAITTGIGLLGPAAPRSQPAAVSLAERADSRNLTAPETSALSVSPDREQSATHQATTSRMTRLDLLSGTVVGPGGLPLLGARVLAMHGPGADWQPPKPLAITDEAGRFSTATPQGAGDYVARIQPPLDSQLSARIVTIRSGHSTLVVLRRGGRIEGRCHDARARPVAGHIRALARDWSSVQALDPDGRFTLTSAPPGRVHLTAYPAGSSAMVHETTVTVSTAATTHVRMSLLAGQTLTGKVTNTLGAPLPHAKVQLSHSASKLGEPTVVETDEDGQFRLPGIPAGEAHLVARGLDQSAGPFVIEVPPGQDPEPITLRLSAGQFVEVHTADPLGVPLNNVNCNTLPANHNATTDRDGKALLGPLPAGDHVLTASHQGSISATALISISTGKGFTASGGTLLQPPCLGVPADVPVLLVLATATKIEGTVLLPTGAPAATAIVEIDDGQSEPHRRSTDSTGHFSCSGIAPGQARVSARAPGTGLVATMVTAHPGAAAEVRLSLPVASWLAGRVTDGQGRGLSTASIRVMGTWGELITYADADGHYALGGLGEGPVQVEARAPGHWATLKDGIAINSDLDLVLIREHRVTGRVHSPAGEPVARFVVEGAPLPSTNEPTIFSDGHFELLLPQGKVTLTIVAEGLVPRTILLPPGQASVNVILEAGATSAGRVTNRQGDPIAGVAVLRGSPREEDLLSDMSFVHVLAMTDTSGRFRINGIPDDGLPVTMSHPDFAPREVTLDPGSERDVEMLPGGRVQGRLIAGQGATGGIGVLIEGPVVRRTTTDSHGYFSIGGLANGSYHVSALGERPTKVVEIQISGPQSIWVDLR